MPRWKKPIPMPNYIPSPEEQKWHKHCLDKGIIISPIGIQGEQNKWKIGIAMASDYRNIHYAPYEYDRDTIWVSYYEMCKYYYDKHRR